jgi:hypothetical protein
MAISGTDLIRIGCFQLTSPHENSNLDARLAPHTSTLNSLFIRPSLCPLGEPTKAWINRLSLPLSYRLSMS